MNNFCTLLMLSITIGVAYSQATLDNIHPIYKEVVDCYIKSKPVDEAKFSTCLLEFWNRNKAKLVAGIPELKLPPLDPLKIQNIVFNEKGSVVDVNAKFTDVVVTGAGDHTAKALKVDRAKRTLTLSLTFPQLNSTGTYEANGTILLLAVNGKGPFTLSLKGVNADAVATLVNEGGKIKISKVDTTFNITELKVTVSGLLGGGEVETAIVNMLNDNSQQILDDIRPNLQKQLSDSILHALQGFFSQEQEIFQQAWQCVLIDPTTCPKEVQ